jgi:hypothetical protein
MNGLIVSVALWGTLCGADPAEEATPPVENSLDAAVDAYERLATVIIEVRRTEDSVVSTILFHHYQAAREQLAAAQSGEDVKAHLEAAATEISYLANEGDKRVQAIRQRLAKAGHTHISDVDTGEDYLWVSSKEKKALLDTAKEIAQLKEDSAAEEIQAAAGKLTALFEEAMQTE